MAIDRPEAGQFTPLPSLEVLNQPEVIWGLAKDLHTQFNDPTDQEGRTPPVKLRLELSDEVGSETRQADFTLAESSGEGLGSPLMLQQIEDRGVLGESLFTFKPPHVLPASIVDQYGATMSSQNDWQFPRRVLVCMRDKLQEQVLAPLETFDLTAFLEAAGISEEPVATEAQAGTPIKATIKIEPGLPLLGHDEAVNMTDDLEAVSLPNIIARAVEHFRDVNGHNPGWAAELSVVRGAFAHDVPKAVWQAYYKAQARQTGFEQLAINRVLARQAAQKATSV